MSSIACSLSTGLIAVRRKHAWYVRRSTRCKPRSMQKRLTTKTIPRCLKQHRALDDTITRINWVSTELVRTQRHDPRVLGPRGRPTVKLEAERAAYLEEQAKWPTDALFEQERFLDLGIADTFADWVPGEMTAHLWRNQRIYRFVFHAGSDAAGVPVSLETCRAQGPCLAGGLSNPRAIRNPAAARLLPAVRVHCRRWRPASFDNAGLQPRGQPAPAAPPEHGARDQERRPISCRSCWSR